MFLHAKSCKGLSELNDFFKKINPNEFVNIVSERFGYETYYTIIYKSNNEYPMY